MIKDIRPKTGFLDRTHHYGCGPGLRSQTGVVPRRLPSQGILAERTRI